MTRGYPTAAQLKKDRETILKEVRNPAAPWMTFMVKDTKINDNRDKRGLLG